MKTEDTTCDQCGAEPRALICDDCGETGTYTDCGHMQQPRPIAALGHHNYCDDCAARRDVWQPLVQQAREMGLRVHRDGDRIFIDDNRYPVEWLEIDGDGIWFVNVGWRSRIGTGLTLRQLTAHLKETET